MWWAERKSFRLSCLPVPENPIRFEPGKSDNSRTRNPSLTKNVIIIKFGQSNQNSSPIVPQSIGSNAIQNPIFSHILYIECSVYSSCVCNTRLQFNSSWRSCTNCWMNFSFLPQAPSESCSGLTLQVWFESSLSLNFSPVNDCLQCLVYMSMTLAD